MMDCVPGDDPDDLDNDSMVSITFWFGGSARSSSERSLRFSERDDDDDDADDGGGDAKNGDDLLGPF